MGGGGESLVVNSDGYEPVCPRDFVHLSTYDGAITVNNIKSITSSQHHMVRSWVNID